MSAEQVRIKFYAWLEEEKKLVRVIGMKWNRDDGRISHITIPFEGTGGMELAADQHDYKVLRRGATRQLDGGYANQEVIEGHILETYAYRGEGGKAKVRGTVVLDPLYDRLFVSISKEWLKAANISEAFEMMDLSWTMGYKILGLVHEKPELLNLEETL